MINVLAIIGVIKKCYSENGKYYLLLKVENDLYDEKKEEFFLVQLWKGIYKDVNPQLMYKEDLVIGIKGRIETENEKTIIVAEKITYLGKK